MSITIDSHRNTQAGNILSGRWRKGNKPSLGLTVAAVSQDQIDVSWDAAAGYGVVIERSVSEVGPFNVVAFYDETISSARLYSHQPGSTYYFRARHVSPTVTSEYSSVVNATTSAAINTYHVATTGNDTTGDGTLGNPYASIQKAVHVATAGDVVNVHAGTYEEFGTWPNASAVNHSGQRVGVALVNSGTPTAPIIIQANPGDTVTMNQNLDKLGFYFAGSTNPWPDYIHIKGITITNAFASAILSADGTSDYSDNDTLVSRGVVIEGNTITNTRFYTDGTNSAAIRMDTHRDWVIRNNTIDASIRDAGGYDINGSGCVYSYGGFDALVEFNTFNAVGGYSAVYWKDTADNNPAHPAVQSIIRYNRFNDFENTIYLNAGDAGTESDGYHKVQYNTFHNCKGSWNTTGLKQAARVDFDNNFVYHGAKQAYSFALSTAANAVGDQIIKHTGNIISAVNGGDNFNVLTSSNADIQDLDYNIYEDGPYLSIDYGSPRLTTLATVQGNSSALISDPSPEANSREGDVLSVLATDASAGDYNIPVGSPALQFMPDGTNAGPYRYGSEQIGVIA